MKIKNRLFSLYMKVNYIVAAAMMMVVVSCTEQIDVETSAGAGLQIKVVNDGMFDSEKGGTRATYSGLTTTFEDGDSIGIYAVQGTTVKHANVKATLNNGTWFLHDFVKYSDNYTYYAYFPYQKTPSTPDFTQSTLDTKFGGMISGWSVADDQSTTAKFKANDLMLAQGSNTSDNVITFQMTHKMSLTILRSNTSCTMSYSSAPDVKTPVALYFSNKIPLYNSSEEKYYFIMKPNTLTSIGGCQVKAAGGKYIERNIGDINDNYTIQYSTDNGATYTDSKPDWVVSINETRNPGEPLNFCVTANPPENGTGLSYIGVDSINTSHDILSQATAVSNYDLSTHDIYGNDCARTTANCYMIHAPGTYKLPLVYGNAIKNGNTNTNAYTTDVTVTNNYYKVRSNFVNHADNPITGPWLKDHTGATPVSAELLWQDAKGLISQVGLSGDYLTFTVPSENIQDGNAVIAVKNSSGTIVWSWHIWVTSIDWSDKITRVNTSMRDYYISPVVLGWVTPRTRVVKYGGRYCRVKITTETGAQIDFKVDQPIFSQSYYGGDNTYYNYKPYCTYYQWGRKDPLSGFTFGNAAFHRTLYNISGDDITATTKPLANLIHEAVSAGSAISNPISMYHGNQETSTRSHWENEYYVNNWDNDRNLARATSQYSSRLKDYTVKTVYDPCPPGFCVPTEDIFYYFLSRLSAQVASDISGVNEKVILSESDPNIYGNDIHFYFMGYISNGGVEGLASSGTSYNYIGTTALVVTSASERQTGNFHIATTFNAVNIAVGDMGRQIRAVRED